jgi:hypothetical protein
MSVKFYVDGNGVYLGAFNGAGPANSVEVSSAPSKASAVWSGSDWVLPTINYTTLSKLKAIDYLISTSQFDEFMVFIESSKQREQRWIVSNNLDINDRMMNDYRDEFNVSTEELQALFNQLNA